MARLTRDALRRMSLKLRAQDKLRSAVAVFKAFTIKLPDEYGGVEFGMDIDAALGSADSGDLEYDLGALFQELGEVARSNATGFVFLIDEMQFLKKQDMEALCAAMHRMGQKLLPVGLAAAGLPQLPGLLVEAKSYAERLFAYPRLGKLPPEAARAALREPAQRAGAEFEDEALKHILMYTEGYPYFVDGPQGSGAIADHMHRRVTSVSLTRGSLIKKGLVYSPDTGLADFTVPHFADFMRRRYPFPAQASEAPAR